MADGMLRHLGNTARLVLLLVVTAASVVNPLPAQSLSGEERQHISGLLTRAYEILPTNSREAMRLFEEVVSLESSNVLARRQLGSMYLGDERRTDALRQFAIANYLLPSDTTSLQLAYLLTSLDRNREALGYFKDLRSSADPEIRAKARIGAFVLSNVPCSRDEWWGRVYAAPYYDDRFDNTILSASLHLGRVIAGEHVLSLYGTAGFVSDTRSRGGAIPVILSDNYVLVGGGLRFEPLRNLTMDVQGGGAINLTDRPDRPASEEDFRALLSYGAGWFPDLQLPENIHAPFTPFADVYLSGGYYSRYKNTIGYLQGRAGVRFLEWNLSMLDLYVRGDFAADTERRFFNNIGEVSVGARLIPHYPLGISILAEYHRGVYWDKSLTTGGYDRYYNSFRLFLVLDKDLCLQ